MRRLIAVLLVFAGLGWAQESLSRNPAELPVKRVVLYKNGVGYFEHVGHVSGNQELKIQFTTGQLNDVLKSLTVVDLDGGTISSVRYNSIAPLSEHLGNLRLRLGEQTSRYDFLNAIRGARVEVRDGSLSAVGKLLSVESSRRILRDQIADMQQVVIVTDSGELRTFDLTPTTTVRLAETELTQEVGRYLDLIGSSRAKDLRAMSIATSGKGDREVVVSYISEVPVWKSTYRIVMPKGAGQKPLLQGWAIVDNTIGEDWKNVELSLVAGSPQSFVQQISQPMYVRRPTVDLPRSAMLTPQTHEATMDEPAPPPPPPVTLNGVGVGIGAGSGGGIGGGVYRIGGGVSSAVVNGRVVDPTGAVVPNARVSVINGQTGQTFQAVTDANGYYNVSVTPGQSTIRVEMPGFRSMQTNRQIAPLSSLNFSPTMQVASTDQMVEVSAEAASVDTTSASVVSRTAGISVDAEGRPLGDLFEYALKQKITVLQNQSALVPIVHSPIAAEHVTVWNPEDQAPLRALWVKNTSGITLDAGSFNIIEGDAFAGEGMMAELHPDERRLISYAADTAVRVESNEDDDNDTPYTHITIAKGLMKLTREERNSVTYRIRNTDTEPRDVIIEHPVQEGWQLKDGLKPEESTSSFQRFRVKVEPNKTAELAVAEFKPEETQYAISNLTGDQVALFVSVKALDPSIERSLRDVLAKKNEIGRVDNEILGRKQEISRIGQEQSRLRDNMKVLKGSAEEKALLQRYVRQMNVQEDRLATLNGEIDKFEVQRQRLAAELDRMVQNIAVDEKLDTPVSARASN